MRYLEFPWVGHFFRVVISVGAVPGGLLRVQGCEYRDGVLSAVADKARGGAPFGDVTDEDASYSGGRQLPVRHQSIGTYDSGDSEGAFHRHEQTVTLV